MLLSNMELLAAAPGGVAKLRELILTLAVQGKLVPQDPADEPAGVLLQKIRAEKDRLIAEGKIKRDKPLAEIAEEEPFELPEGWAWQTLAGIGTWAIGSGFPHEAQGREGLPILFAKVSDMNLPGNELEIVRTNHTIDDETVERLRINVHQPGTVIFPKIGGAIATNKRRILIRPTAIDNNCLGLTPSAAMSTSYLFLLLSSIDFTVYQAGTSVPALSQGALGQIPVGLPPLAEQSRIVTRVEALMRLCDALEAKGQLEAAQHAQLVSTLLGTLTASTTPEELAAHWQRVAQHFDLLLDRPAAIDALEQTLLQLAVRGLLVPQDPTDEPASALLQKIRAEKDQLIATGQIKRDKPLPPITDEEKPFELPMGWEWCQLDELVTIRGGKRVSNGYQLLTVPTEFIYIRVSDMKDGSIDDSDLRYLDPQMRSAISRYIITKDDIYMTIVGATIGKCGLVPERFDGMNLTENAARLTPHLVSKDYLFRLLASEFCQEQFLGKTKQVGVQKMALNRLAGTLIPLPPLAEQSRIVTRITALRRLCADLRQRLAGAQTTQSHLAQALVDSTSFV